MGLLPPQELGVQQSLFYAEDPSAAANPSRSPQVGVNFSGIKTDYTMADIVAANGPRSPDHTVSQKRYRMAIVLITQDGAPPTDEEFEKLDRVRREFENFFTAATGFRAVIDTELVSALNFSAYPAAGVAAGQPALVSVDLESPAPQDLFISFGQSGAPVDLPGGITIPQGQQSASFNATVQQAGVAKIQAFPDSENYPISEFNLQAVEGQDLQVNLLGGGRQLVTPGQPLPEPIRVSVTGPNLLFFRGVTLVFEPDEGGSVNSTTLQTDANGVVNFIWTPGESFIPTATVFVQGARETTAITVTAQTTTDIQINAATNGATFEPGLSPGALATLFGINLAAGEELSAISQPLPITLGTVEIRVNGVRAPLLFVSDTQVNFLVPNIAGDTATVVLETEEGVSNSFETPLNLYAPGIFFDAGTNLGAILVSGSSVKTDQRPAAPGEAAEVFATGLTNLSSADLGRVRGKRSAQVLRLLGDGAYKEAIHRDNMLVRSPGDERRKR
jgi:hypothetical protein